MARTPEAVVKEAVKKVLKQFGAYWHMPVMNGMGAPALDFHCCVKGRAFFIETKAGSKGPTPRQKITIAEIQKAGAPAFIINELTGTQMLETWLTEVINA